MLKELIEARDAAAEAFKADAEEYRAIEGDASEERTAQYEAARAKVKEIDERIAEVRDEAKRAEAVEEARKELKEVAPVVVHNEQRTYGHGSDNSYFQDLAFSALPGRPEYQPAVERLAAHSNEVQRDTINDSELRARVADQVRTNFRKDESRARAGINALESRAMSTASGSGLSFVTPVYLVDEYAPFVEYGRTFIDAANKQDLPDYGMTVFIPAVQAAAGTGVQTAENTGITESDPTTGYLSNSLSTEAGQITLSQQLLDRAGPGVQFDTIAFDQLQRSYNQNIDSAVLAAVLGTANIGSISNAKTGTSTGNVFQSLLSDVAAAQANMATAEGTVMSATHLFTTATEWAYLQTQLDGQGRPLIGGSDINQFNAAASPSDSVAPEGATGAKVLSYPLFKDNNIPSTGSNTQLILAHMPEVYVWESSLVQRTVPQTLANQLSVLVQVYSYWTVILRYPRAVQVISGNRYPATPSYIQV